MWPAPAPGPGSRPRPPLVVVGDTAEGQQCSLARPSHQYYYRATLLTTLSPWPHSCLVTLTLLGHRLAPNFERMHAVTRFHVKVVLLCSELG